MKYNDLSLGQIEAIVNKLGGMEGVQNFLSEKIVVKPVVKIYRLKVHYVYQNWSNKHEIILVYKTHEDPRKINSDVLKSRLWCYKGMHSGNMCDNLIIDKVEEIKESEIHDSDLVLEYIISRIPVTTLKE